MTERSLVEIAHTLHTTPDHLRLLISHVLRPLPQQTYYIFRATHAAYHPQTVAAFASPDDALIYAQRSGYGPGVQLRAASAEDLVLDMLHDPAIGAVIFERSPADEGEPATHKALTIRRDALVAALESTPTTSASMPNDLSAKAYDQLQFGVDFSQRAAFRVALTQAVEQIVTDYRPPSGSLDQGPRSIYAASVVEQWLRDHGFPHVHQRRWVSVAHDPQWGGAVELCELDAGSQNRLLVQLVIHADDSGRQYIKWVNVTA